MKITNLNPDSDIGATAWFLELEGHRLLMDAGTHPKREGRASLLMWVVAVDLRHLALSPREC